MNYTQFTPKHVKYELSNKQEPYGNTPQVYTNTHMGARKLLLTEQFFFKTISEHADLNKTVCLYVGSAKAANVHFHLTMYPGMKFILYDEVEPVDIVRRHPNVSYYTEYFYDNTEVNIPDGYKLIFISDIRDDVDEAHVNNNMLQQQRWILRLCPDFSMVKYRLPYMGTDFKNNMLTKDEQTKVIGKPVNGYHYLKGNIIYQPWAPNRSAETRLIVFKTQYLDDSYPPDKYIYGSEDPVVYDNKLNYHNLYTRGNAKYIYKKSNMVTDIFGFDASYDCVYEYYIAYYITKSHKGACAFINKVEDHIIATTNHNIVFSKLKTMVKKYDRFLACKRSEPELKVIRDDIKAYLDIDHFNKMLDNTCHKHKYDGMRASNIAKIVNCQFKWLYTKI